MNNFVFENSTRFYFGKGQLEVALERELADATCVMIAYGGGSVKRTGLFGRIVAALSGRRIVEFGSIMANPTIDKVVEGGELARAEGVDYILGVGGGSVITNPRTLVKTGADCPQLNARFAVQEPELTLSVPASQKIAGGYDALNHMMEEYFSGPVGENLADDLL